MPANVAPAARPLLVARGLRAFADGFVSVLLPAYLLALGLDVLDVGVLATTTMLGSAFGTLAIGAFGHRYASRALLRAAAALMAITGLAFAAVSSFWPLAIVAFVGTLNPSSGDVSVFLPLEQASLAETADGRTRPALFARYSVIGAACAALGALCVGLPDAIVGWTGIARLDALRGMFVIYAAIGVAVWFLYRATSTDVAAAAVPPTPLGPSRRVVVRLAALFSIDSFAGGLVVNALLSLWLMTRFGLSLSATGRFFFVAGLLSAASQLAAPWVADRIGLLNTMVFTHIPASVCLVAAALVPSMPWAVALLLMRSALSQMDVPVRTAYVMAVVTPAERAAAASFTAVPRSLAAAISPSLATALFAAGFLAVPLVACGVLKIGYDVALWRACREDRLDTR